MAQLVLAAAMIVFVALRAPAAAAPQVAVPPSRQATAVAIVPLHGEVDAVTRASVERRISEAASRGAGAAVIELDTPGGDLAATLDLCLWVKDRAPIPVWAWIRPQAYSAGTIIALACRGILVAPGAAFGDAAPIAAIPGLGLQPLPAAERAKIEAPVLAEVVDSARRRGHDETLVRAFIVAPEEAWLLERDDGSERIFVGRPEFRDAFGTDPPSTRVRAAVPATIDPGPAVRPFADLSLRRGADDGPRNDEERDRMVEDQQLRPAVRARLTPADAASWRVVTQVDGPDELLVLHEPEAIASGLAIRRIADERELRDWFGATASVRIEENWGDALVRLLTSWPVRLLLVAVIVGGFIVEMAAPGLGWFGGAATVALLLLLGGPALGGVTAWWPLLLVAAGAALVAVEVFVVPGVGIVGFAGGACALVGLVGGFVDAPLDTAQGRSDLAAALGTIAGGGILAGAGAWAVMRALPRSIAARAVVLDTAVGGTGAPDRAAHAGIAAGTEGTAITPLRPVGKVSVGGAVLEATAVGGMVEAGRPVTVVRSTPYALEVEERRP
jgi:membrane-bound ClpP family serine protease